MNRRTTLITTLIGACLLVVTGLPASAQQGQRANLRLAHLSPTTSPMDVYVAPADGGQESALIRKMGYGAVSDYTQLDAGVYSFIWRPAGAPADQPGVLELTAELDPGSASTLVGLGVDDDVRTTLVADDLSQPDDGTARVRFVNADAESGPVTLQAVDGPVLADEVAFGSVTDYAEVPARSWQVEVTTDELGDGTETPVTLTDGTVTTLFLLDADSPVGDLSQVVDRRGQAADERREGSDGMAPVADVSVLNQVQDATGSPDAPTVTGIQTGAGGTADAPSTPTPLLAIAAVVALAALAVRSTRTHRAGGRS